MAKDTHARVCGNGQRDERNKSMIKSRGARLHASCAHTRFVCVIIAKAGLDRNGAGKPEVITTDKHYMQ